jgi:hypothetical protein
MTTRSLDETIVAWREELMGYLEKMWTFQDIQDPKEILPMISAFSVRARFMSSAMAPKESRKAKDFRYEEIIPFLNECVFQDKIWSRMGTLVKDEWDMAKG